jgi:glycosyltransferase domain-containing protein
MLLKRLFKDVFRSNRSADTSPAERGDGQGSHKVLSTTVARAATHDGTPPDLWRRDHSPLRDLTIIVPILPGRGAFLDTLLNHFSTSRIGCQIIMTVNSDAEQEPEVERLVAGHPGLAVSVVYHPMAVHFVDRLTACARRATTKYVFVHSDDDFVVPGVLADCVDFLNEHDDYVACEGRSFFFSVKNGVDFVPHPQRFMSREEARSVERVLQHCRLYTNTFHAVTRREAFITSNDETMARTRQVIFWQYLASCWLISLGKLKVLDRLYYLRLDNPRGERASLMKRADRSHWPYLVVAPDFSMEQERFKGGLIDAMQGQASPEQLADVVDECCLGLVRRAFGAQLKFDPAELEMNARFADASSYESQIGRYCAPRTLKCLNSVTAPSVAPAPPAAAVN